jgi:hypothetical protein
MRTFSRYLLESPIDELPPTIKGEHPHKILDTYREEMESAIRDENWPPQADIGFTTRSIYYDPDREVTSNISMDHATPGWAERKDGNQGVAHVVVGVSGKTNDKSKSKFHMPGEVMGIIDSSHRHLHHFIGENTPRGLHTIEYETKDPKRHALYQHMARLHPHITFKNISKLKSVKRKPKPVAVSESYTVNTNYWNTANINKFILESPLDELPAAVEGTHPHQTEDTYEDQKSSAGHWMKMHPHEAPVSFKSKHTYHDPDGRVTTNIEMQHRTPGWKGDPHPSTGIATVGVSVGGVYNDSSQTGSRFYMPGEIMGKIASSSSHLHDFITKHKPHTVEYDTDDPKRHALYQHMSRLYPRILFRNTGELKPVKRKPSKAVAVSESYTKKQMDTANQTSRNSGAIGKKAITPAYVRTITDKKHKILDFGSGRDAAHTKVLRKTGRNVTAHEFGANVNQNHDPKALEKKYDTVFASNVLNTASSRKMLRNTLDQMHSAVAPGGALVANLPLSPRKSVKVDAKHLMGQLMKRFGDVRRVGGTKKAPLFHATGPK